jgi:hypothetical protein
MYTVPVYVHSPQQGCFLHGRYAGSKCNHTLSLHHFLALAATGYRILCSGPLESSKSAAPNGKALCTSSRDICLTGHCFFRTWRQTVPEVGSPEVGSPYPRRLYVLTLAFSQLLFAFSTGPQIPPILPRSHGVPYCLLCVTTCA